MKRIALMILAISLMAACKKEEPEPKPEPPPITEAETEFRIIGTEHYTKAVIDWESPYSPGQHNIIFHNVRLPGTLVEDTAITVTIKARKVYIYFSSPSAKNILTVNTKYKSYEFKFDSIHDKLKTLIVDLW